MVDTQVLPAGHAYHGRVAGQVAAARAAGVEAPQTDSLKHLGALLQAVTSKRRELEKAFQEVEARTADEERARGLSGPVATAMSELRRACDELEGVVSDDQWPLPKYRELLFIS
jgi:glutamine synthetase